MALNPLANVYPG